MITTSDYDYEVDHWKNISIEARKMIDNLIQPNINLRLTAMEALNHPWIKKFVDPPKVAE